jgi:hypothetical protein
MKTHGVLAPFLALALILSALSISYTTAQPVPRNGAGDVSSLFMTRTQAQSLESAHIDWAATEPTEPQENPESIKAVDQPASNWQIETVDGVGWCGGLTSLSLDGMDRPHISYRFDDCYYGGEDNDGIKYAWHDGAAWQIEMVDGGGVGGGALALDGSGNPHIVYEDSVGIAYARKNGLNWEIEVVATHPYIGPLGWESQTYGCPSLALDDSTGRAHLSYLFTIPGWGKIEGSTSLKYAWHDGAAWQYETVSSGASCDHSLALDDLGQPSISYYDGRLRYASRDGAAWQIETVDDGLFVNMWPSLVLDQSGWPHISYHNAGSKDLLYAWYDGTTWYTTTVDTEGFVGLDSSLALDEAELPHISYYDHTNKSLKYARYNGADWEIETVDSDGYVGEYTSLALDRANCPHISYYDVSNQGLKYARLIPPPLFLQKQASPSDGLPNNGTLTYTLTLSGPGLNVNLSDPLPHAVHYVSGSLTSTLTPPAVYSPTAHAVVWAGTPPTGTVQTVQFQVTPGITGTGSLDLAAPIVNTAWVTSTHCMVDTSATVIVNAYRLYFPSIWKDQELNYSTVGH